MAPGPRSRVFNQRESQGPNADADWPWGPRPSGQPATSVRYLELLPKEQKMTRLGIILNATVAKMLW